MSICSASSSAKLSRPFVSRSVRWAYRSDKGFRNARLIVEQFSVVQACCGIVCVLLSGHAARRGRYVMPRQQTEQAGD